MKAMKIVLIGAMLAAGVAHAEGERTDPNAKMRSDLMKGVGGATKVLADMAAGKTAHDAAAAEAAKAKLIDSAGMVAEAFKTEGDLDPASEAKPEIWTNWDDFLKKTGDMKAAAEAADVSSAAAIGASMAAIGGSCKACHDTYRIKL